MKYLDFLEKFQTYPVITLADIRTVFPTFNPRRLYEWQKTNKIKKISNGFYVFSDKKLNEVETCFIANKLREPSYISLEYALSYYSLIPETVFLRTNITTKKTAFIKSAIGDFSYRSIKENLFFGYTIKEMGGIKFKIAEPEKALLDFLYLRSDIKNLPDIESLRINKDSFQERVSEEKLDFYTKKFQSPTLKRKVKTLKDYIKQND